MQDDLSRVVDALPGLVWTAQEDGEIDFLNQGWCEYTGLTAGELSSGGWHAATVVPVCGGPGGVAVDDSVSRAGAGAD